MESKLSCGVTAADLVTETDQAVEKFVLGRIKEKYPDYEYDPPSPGCCRILFIVFCCYSDESR